MAQDDVICGDAKRPIMNIGNSKRNRETFPKFVVNKEEKKNRLKELDTLHLQEETGNQNGRQQQL